MFLCVKLIHLGGSQHFFSAPFLEKSCINACTFYIYMNYMDVKGVQKKPIA